MASGLGGAGVSRSWASGLWAQGSDFGALSFGVLKPRGFCVSGLRVEEEPSIVYLPHLRVPR